MPGWQDFTDLSQDFLAADLLLSDLTGKLAPSLTYLPTIEHNVSALSVSLTPQANCTITVKITDATGIVPTWSQQQTVGSAPEALQFVSPYSYTTASALSIVVTSSVNQTFNAPTFIWGYGTALAGQQGVALVRSDGRAFPIGEHAAHGTNTAGGTLQVAPGAGVRILLASGFVSVNALAGAVAYCVLQGFVNGVQTTIGGAVSPANGFTSNPLFLPAGGLLLDANTALTYASGGPPASNAADAVWDLVT